MRALILLCIASLCPAQLLTTGRVSSLNNRYSGRQFGRVRAPMDVTSGLVGWYKPDTLSATDGAAITSWTDSSGAGNNATCTSPCPVVMRNAYFEYPAAAFTSTTGSQPAAGTPMVISAMALPLRAMTVFAIYRRQGVDGNTTDLNSAQNLLSLFTNESTQVTIGWTLDDHLFVTPDQMSRTGAYVMNAGTPAAPVAAGYMWDGPSMLGFRSNGSEFRFYGDEARTWTISNGTPPASTVTGATLGCYTLAAATPGGWCLSGELYELLAWNRALTDAEAVSVSEYLRDRYGLRRPRATQIIFDTNSIAGGHLGQRHNIATYVADDFQHKYNFRNESMWSYTTAQLNSAAALVVNQYLDSSQKNIVIFSEGLNSLEAGVTEATTYSQLASGCNAYRTAGATVIVPTLTARSTSGSYTDAKRLTVNTSIRNNLATDCTGVIIPDPGADSIIGNAANIGNTTYFQDQAHLALAGARIYANYITAALRGLGL